MAVSRLFRCLKIHREPQHTKFVFACASALTLLRAYRKSGVIQSPTITHNDTEEKYILVPFNTVERIKHIDMLLQSMPFGPIVYVSTVPGYLFLSNMQHILQTILSPCPLDWEHRSHGLTLLCQQICKIFQGKSWPCLTRPRRCRLWLELQPHLDGASNIAALGVRGPPETLGDRPKNRRRGEAKRLHGRPHRCCPAIHI